MWSAVEWKGCGGSGPAPCSRGKHSATLLDGYVYILGGRGAGGSVPLRDFWRFCLASGEWERIEGAGEGPPALQEHSATAHDGRLYVFGGEPGTNSSETPLWIYDVETQTWRKLPGQSPYKGGVRRRAGAKAVAEAVGPRGRRGHSAHALKDCLLVYGGYKDLRGSTNELWAFHYESETWHQVRTANPGPARHRHAAALHDNRLYVHGGQCDLRACADLWHYDTMSRAWSQVVCSGGPAARAGHAGLRAGGHFYVFGGDVAGAPANDLWRFHFATETWERVSGGGQWPAARVDARALLVAAPARGASPDLEPHRPPPAFIARLSSFHIRRAARCSYSVLAGEGESTESLVRHEAALAKSRSAYAVDAPGAALARGPASVPDLEAAAARVVYAGSDDDGASSEAAEAGAVRFRRARADSATSDYASAERVSGFSNPHYLGPDVRALAALTPDSGVAGGPHDLELRPLRARAPRLQLLLLGGREPPHRALLRCPLSMWAYRLL